MPIDMARRPLAFLDFGGTLTAVLPAVLALLVNVVAIFSITGFLVSARVPIIGVPGRMLKIRYEISISASTYILTSSSDLLPF